LSTSAGLSLPALPYRASFITPPQIEATGREPDQVARAVSPVDRVATNARRVAASILAARLATNC
jgi:hypothetical protein